ncbi:MAG: DUF1801 domain-containing protein [Gammaproteobacteria bacterium]|nr:DUF1801 domain-containing protein [Gammaproteobacteria bacterium]
MAELKTKLNEASVETFLACAGENRLQDCQAVLALMQKITKAPPKMWGASIVGFGSYTYKYESGREGVWPLVGFSPRKQNLTLYIMAGFDEYEALMAQLGKHKTGKSCLYINQLSDVDMKVLEKLIKASVKYMKAKYPA